MFYKNAIQYTEAIRLYKTINAFLYPGKDLTARTAVLCSTDLPESVLTYMRKVSWTRSHLLNKSFWWINNFFPLQTYYMFGFYHRIMIGAPTCPTGWPHERSRLAGTSHSAGRKYFFYSGIFLFVHISIIYFPYEDVKYIEWNQASWHLTVLGKNIDC